jgi:hypothetical protein
MPRLRSPRLLTLHGAALMLGFVLLVLGGWWRGASFVLPFLGSYVICYIVVRMACRPGQDMQSPREVTEGH